MSEIERIEAEILILKEKIKPLTHRLSVLKTQLGRERSKEFIRVNGITLENVEKSDGQDKPFFGHVYKFGHWLEKHSEKPWAEWNGRLYLTSELARGLMDPAACGLLSDVSKSNEPH